MDRQHKLEQRYRLLGDRPLDGSRSPQELFGDFDSWLLKLGEHELLLNPVNGSWHEYDRRSDSGRPLGYLVGEVEFSLEGNLVVAKPAPVPDADTAPAPARLQALVGVARGADALLGSETSLGTADDNDIVIVDHHSDEHHAVIRARAEGFVIADLASRTGTFVNGDRVTAPRLLRAGDVIAIGGTQLSFRQSRT